jgi:2-hydroxy-6-oxonona-2,4-dienedioate hydrolase
MSIWVDLAAHPFRLAFVDVAGSATRALQAGTGEPVVLLHGTSSHLEVYSRNVPALADGGFAVHAIDMLGHGWSAKPDRDLEVPDYVEHLAGYLDAIGERKAHLIGESLGGWVAAWFAAEHPDRVRSLQLLASGGTRAVPAVMARIRETTTLAVTDPDRRHTRDRLANLLADPDTIDEDLVDARYAIYHSPQFQAMLPHLLCMQDMTVRQRNLLRPDRMARITAPTRIYWGRHNPMGDVTEAEGIHAAVPGSELEIFEDCGHFPQIEYPAKFNQLAVDFLRKAAETGAGA